MRRILPVILAAALAAGEPDATPARFVVTAEVVNPDPGAFTATTAPARGLIDMEFEPMVQRKAFQAQADAIGKVVSDQLDHYDSYAQGYWDGASVRVLRATDGRIAQVLDGKVARFHHGDWSGVLPGLIPAGTTRATFAIEGWARHGIDWWFTVRAVDTKGRASGDAPAVRLADPVLAKRPVVPNPGVVAMPRRDENPKGGPPPTPKGFSGAIDADGRITLSWDAVDGDLAGYEVRRTYVDPSRHTGTWLELASDGGGAGFAVRTNDLVFLAAEWNTFDGDRFSPRIFDTPAGSPPDYQPWQDRDRVPFTLVAHPPGLPADAADAGRTCMRVELPAGKPVKIRKYNHQHTNQDWYDVLEPGVVYAFELLARQEGMPAAAQARFLLDGPLASQVPPVELAITRDWQRLRGEFTVPVRLTGNEPVGMMGLELSGPGTVWIDAFRVYPKADGLKRWNAADRQEVAASGISSIRTHDTIKTAGYAVEDLFGDPRTALTSGKDVLGRANMAALLAEMRDMRVDPWMQIEFTMTEAEWAAIVEYLAAPFNPAVDTAQSKPWAWRRVQHGQVKPYTEVFRKLLFEFSNENWNPIMPFNLQGRRMPDGKGGWHGPGEIYGMLQEYTIQVMKRSKWWTPELERKAEFVIGGWTVNSFGYEAARMSPSSHHVLVADYNGGWDAGEGPSSDFADALRKTLDFAAQQSRPSGIRLRRERDAAAAQGGRRLAIGSYEAGPGYNMNGLNGARMTKEMVEFESRVMKSLAAGTATLDCFLTQAEQGAGLQNFFTFSRNRHYWSSHAVARNGGQAYPSWMALALHNRFATGDHLKVLTGRVPVHAAAAVGRRKAANDLPDAAVYATRSGDRLAVFAISRRTEGRIPLTLDLPITAAKSVRLHALTGDPQAHNLDAANIAPVTRDLPAGLIAPVFPIDEQRGVGGSGLPPASVLLYVFEGCAFAPGERAILNPAPGQTEQTGTLPIRFRLGTTGAVAPTAADIAISGGAEPQGATIEEVPGSYGMEWTITVPQVLGEGTVQARLRDGFAVEGTAVRPAEAQVRFAFPTGMQLPLLAWDFSAVQQADWAQGPVPASARLPVAAASGLTAESRNLLGDNKWYNEDGAGTWTGGMKPGERFAYRFPFAPSRAVDLAQVACGLWCIQTKDGEQVQASLEIVRGEQVLATVPFSAAKPTTTTGLHHDAGVRAVADVSGVGAVQGLTEAVELRIVLSGLSKGGVFGIGKLGKGVPDIEVLGRIRAR